MSKRRNWVVDDEQIKNAEQKQKFSGAYECVIKECVTGFYPSGAEYIQMRVAIPDRPDESGKPKEYQLERETITAGDAKGNAPTFYMGIFQSAFKLTGTTNKVSKRIANVYDRDAGERIDTKVDQYAELIGKKIGIVIVMNQEYPEKPIDGYTKEPLSWEEFKENPYGVTIPRYTDITGEPSKTFARFSAKRFFSVDKKTYGKTASEIIDGKPAKEIDELCKRVDQYEAKAAVMTDSEVNEYILKKLKKNLKKIQEDFDENRWEKYGEAVENDDMPF